MRIRVIDIFMKYVRVINMQILKMYVQLGGFNECECFNEQYVIDRIYGLAND